MPRLTRRLAPLFAGALILAACRDEPTAPISPATLSPRLAAGGNGNGNGPSSLDLIEDDYALGLLDKDNANRYREYAVSASDKLPQKYQSGALGKDATYSMVQMAKEWASLSASTRKEIRDLRANGFGNLKETVQTAHFVLHYTTQGAWAVAPLDADRNGIPDLIDASARSWEEVYQREVGQLGYPAPKLTVAADGTVSSKFHVYFKDMKFYGYTVPENVDFEPVNGFPSGTASAWIVVENDFAGFPPNDEDVTGPRAGAYGRAQGDAGARVHARAPVQHQRLPVGMADGVARDVGRGRRVRRDQRLALVHQHLSRHTRPSRLQPLRLRLRVLPELAERDVRHRHAATAYGTRRDR